MSIIFQLADSLNSLKQEKKSLEQRLKELNNQLEKTNDQLSQAMLTEEMANFVRGGQMYYLTTKIFASADKFRKDELIGWLKNHSYQAIVKETVNANTLAAFIRELIDEDNLPQELEEMVNIHEKTLVVIRKANH